MILVNSDVFLIVDGRGAVAYGTGMKPNILLLMTDQQRTDALGCVTPWSRRACWGSSTCSGWSAASSLRITRRSQVRVARGASVRRVRPPGRGDAVCGPATAVRRQRHASLRSHHP